MSTLVEVAISQGVATLTLNNPPLNLNSIAMTQAIAAALSRLRADDAVKVLVVTVPDRPRLRIRQPWFPPIRNQTPAPSPPDSHTCVVLHRITYHGSALY